MPPMRSPPLFLPMLACVLSTLACGDEGASSAPDASATDAAIDAPGVAPTFAPGDAPYGTPMNEWAAAWWTWALQLPTTDHPIVGGPCAAGQAGEVFFLAGNFGGVETRACAVPAGKALMFPILNSLCYPQPETQGCATPISTADLVECAAGPFDSGAPIALEVTLDGVAIDAPTSYRHSTGRFSWPAPPFAEAEWLAPSLGPIPANACGLPEGDRFGVGDGYWMILRPLAPGPHTLRITGSLGSFALDVTYQLTQA